MQLPSKERSDTAWTRNAQSLKQFCHSTVLQMIRQTDRKTKEVRTKSVENKYKIFKERKRTKKNISENAINLGYQTCIM